MFLKLAQWRAILSYQELFLPRCRHQCHNISCVASAHLCSAASVHPFSLPIGQLSTKYCLRQTCFWHSSGVAGPPKLWSCDKGFNANGVCSFQDFRIRYCVLPLDKSNCRRWRICVLVSFLMWLRYRILHSVEYSIDGRTAVLYTLIFVANLMSCRNHSLCRAPNAFVAAGILLSTSKSDEFVFVTALSRYVKLSVVFSVAPFT